MWTTIVFWLKFSPIATISALLFYFVLLLALLPSVRRSPLWSLFSLPTPSIQSHIPALDTVRGIAASIVVLAHIWNFCYPIFNETQTKWMRFLAVGGNKCVPVFVILSGFLIYRTVKKIHSMDDLNGYIQRRFFRIYPVYLFTVLLGFLLGQTVFTFPKFLAQVFMVRIVEFHALTFVNPPAWTLYVEVLFYILLPIWVAVFRKRVLPAAIISFIILMFVDSLGTRELWLWKYFFIGIISAEISGSLKKVLSEKNATLLFTVGLVLILMDFHVTRSGHAPFDWFNYLEIIPKNLAEYTIGLGLASMLILIGIVHSSWVSKILGIWPLSMIGTISYSLYLIHPFFILAVFSKLQFVEVGKVQNLIDPVVYAPPWVLPFIMFPGCLAWGLMCFILVERPFLLLSSHIRKAKVKLVHSGVSGSYV